MTQLTIVTHYGAKLPSMAKLIDVLQRKMATSLDSAFMPYELEQVHGTVIGLEGVLVDTKVTNKWFKENLKKDECIDFDGIMEYVLSNRMDEIKIRFGGWWPLKDYGFKSRNQHPYTRSFSFQGDMAVLMGWPVEHGKYCESLYALRKRFEDFNVCHKYNKDGYKDNDFYLVIGKISKADIAPELLEQTAGEIRHLLSEINETLRIGKDTLSIVAYADTQLPLATSKAFSFDAPELTPQLMASLYGNV